MAMLVNVATTGTLRVPVIAVGSWKGPSHYIKENMPIMHIASCYRTRLVPTIQGHPVESLMYPVDV